MGVTAGQIPSKKDPNQAAHRLESCLSQQQETVATRQRLKACSYSGLFIKKELHLRIHRAVLGFSLCASGPWGQLLWQPPWTQTTIPHFELATLPPGYRTTWLEIPPPC